MSADRYVIVYREGGHSGANSKWLADLIIANPGCLGPHRTPAYRIRIREKARAPILSGREARQALARKDYQAVIDGLRDVRL